MRRARHKAVVAAAALMVSLAGPGAVSGAVVTGDPSMDSGWALAGNSLASGVYVDGGANYSFEAYGAGFTIQSGSDLEISDGADSWLAGDTVVGAGGRFTAITAAEAGWSAFTGGGVNAHLHAGGPKLQVKFGTAAATWTTSVTAPGGGDGSGSSSRGGGRVQVRTSGYFSPDAPSSGRGYTWDGDSGELLMLDKDSHLTWDGDENASAARMIWIWDDAAGHVESWQLLLNVSLLARSDADFAGLLPGIGDPAIMTVQSGGGDYTNALIRTVPEPGSLALLGILAGAMLLRRRHVGG